MEAGFGIGLVGGTVLGAAGGAWEARGADQLRQQVAGALRERAAAAMQPASLDDDLLSRLLLEELRENPTAGTNQQLIELTPGVWTALHDPDTLAAAIVGGVARGAPARPAGTDRGGRTLRRGGA